MTDEEKAEEYAIEDLPDGYTKINYVKKQAYLDGLAKGRKDYEEKNKILKEYIAKLEYLIRNHTDFILIEGNENGDMYGLWKSIKMRIGL